MTQLPSPGRLRGATLYIDCFAGIAGDMTLAALIDLGVPESFIRDALRHLPLPPYELKLSTVRRGSLMARKVDVVSISDVPEPPEQSHSPSHDHSHLHSHDHSHPHSHDHSHPHSHDHSHPHSHDHSHARRAVQRPHLRRDAAHDGHAPHVHYAQIRAQIEQAGEAGLAADIVARSLAMFDRLAAVEAALHGVDIGQVEFHEVGALDSIVDIVGVAAALSYLAPRRVVSRPVALGSGRVRTAHGLLPVPAPATLALLREVPVEAGGPPHELTTPTGAVILAVHAQAYGSLPPLRVLAVGHGAGTRELSDRPNLLRIIAGLEEAESQASAGSDCIVLETNLDDMNPQIYGPLLEALLQAGARDAWLVPVHMKKGRPGIVLSVLCDAPRQAELTTLMLRETTSLGVRSHAVGRRMLSRELLTVHTEFGDIPLKVGRDPQTGEIWNAAPEFAVCVERATAHRVPIKQVLAAALAAYHHDGG